MSNCSIYSTSLTHHGIKGQKWGVRRFQNPDGSYTNTGKKRYNANDADQQNNAESAAKRAKRIKAVKIGVAVVGTALVAYGAYKAADVAGQRIRDKAIEHARKVGEEKVRIWRAVSDKYTTKYFDSTDPLESRVYLDKAYRSGEHYRSAKKRMNSEVSKLAGSTIESAKYLYNLRKKK